MHGTENLSAQYMRVYFRCRTDSCPTRQFPGVWEIPLNSHYIGTLLHTARCTIHNVVSLHRSTDAQCALHATYVHCCTLHTKYYTLLHPAHIATNCWLCNVLENAASCPEGYAAGHCPYLDQCVFTHMDAADILDWIKVGQGRRRAGEGKEGVGRSRIWVRVTQSGAGVEAWTWEGAGAGARAGAGAGAGPGAGAGAKHFQEDFLRHYTTNKAPYTLAMHTNWFQEQSQVMNALCRSALQNCSLLGCPLLNCHISGFQTFSNTKQMSP